MKYTLLDRDIPVDQDSWAVAIVRKPQGTNPEHAFLLVEGRSDSNQVILKRYDMVINNADPTKFTIVVKERMVSEANAVRVLQDELLGGDDVVGKSWSISKEEAVKLHDNILDSKDNPGNYNLIGQGTSVPATAGVTHAHSPALGEKIQESGKNIGEAISGKTAGLFAEAALSPPGHNCFTWARMMLYSLKIEEIQRDLPRSPLDIIAVIPSRHVNQKEMAKEPVSGPEFNCTIS